MSSPTIRSLLDTLTDVFFVFDESGELVEWNEAAVEVTGYSTEELRSMCPADFFDDADAEEVACAVDEIVETGETTVEARLVTADGARIPYEFSVSRLTDEAGTPVGFAGIGRDFTTERRERERLQQHEQTLRAMHEIIADRTRPFTEQVEALLELGRAELGVDYGTLSRIRGEEYVFEVVSADDDAIESGDVVPLSVTNCELVATNEQTLVASDVGRDVPVADERAGYTEWGINCYLGAPVYVDGEVYGTFCFYGTEPRTEPFSEWETTLTDLMSRWVSYEIQREAISERLHRQNETLEQFIAMVSHDLRNPLNVMQGSLHLAEEADDTESFERCRRAISRMDALIDDLLALARSGTEIRDMADVNVDPVAKRCWQMVPTSQATLQVESEAVVRADEARLQQLLENLFRNAVEHGSTGDDSTAPLTVTVGNLAGGFYVEDDGSGIPSDERARVFESGYSSNPGGTGLGLAIVERIANAHGWDIDLTESADGGTRFEFTGVTVVSSGDH